MKIKVAIITHYYKSVNYGGNLQAYALTRYLNQNGYNAVQISYPFVYDSSSLSLKERLLQKFKESPLLFLGFVLKKIVFIFIDLFNKTKLAKLQEINKKRLQSFAHFQLDLIPHTSTVYDEKTLKTLNADFDAFITGSDQVFNLEMMRPGFFLTFVNDKKTKISYAASMALNSIPKNKEDFCKESLERFDAIGVREEKTVFLLSRLLNSRIVLNVDPVFLLEKSEWEQVCSDRVIKEDYLFCYFLGKNSFSRKEAKQFAHKYGLKIVCIPFCTTRYNLLDEQFGDVNIPYASPEDFLSLIKNAKCIFTDSFHACAFSIIFDKMFFVFDRDKGAKMSSRIVTLTKLFKIEDQYIKNNSSNKLFLDDGILNECKINNFMYKSDEFYALKKSSIQFIDANLRVGK